MSNLTQYDLKFQDKELSKCLKCDAQFEDKELLFRHIAAEHMTGNDASLFTLRGLTAVAGTSYPLVERRPDLNQVKKKKSSPKSTKTNENTTDIRQISLDSPFMCMQQMENGDPCSTIFEGCCRYSKHFIDVHQYKNQWKCLICERLLKKVNLEEPPDLGNLYKCDECFKVFLDKYSLRRHYKFHVTAKPYECSECGKGFYRSATLLNHWSIHEDTTFTCEYCSKSFKTKLRLSRHMRTHSDEKPYQCVVCSKPYKQSTNLRRHMRMHTNIKPYGCPHCNEAFRLAQQLKRHLHECHEISSLAQVNDEDIEVELVDHNYC